MWNLISIRLEIVLVLVQDSCTVYARRTMDSKIVLDTMMVLLCIEAQVDARFGLFGDSANLDARSLHGLRRTYHRLGNHFLRTRLNT